MDFTAILTAIASLFSVPSVTLAVMLGAAWFMVMSAQKRDDFDFGNMLKDDTGKESATRMAILVAICFSSWALMTDTLMRNAVDTNLFMIYLGIWSGTKVAEKALDAVIAKWSK